MEGQVQQADRRAKRSRDLIQGPITSTLLIFSLPVLGANALQSLNGSVNQFWVSHLLGVTAITAIGNANIVMMLMLGAIFGVSMAANILIGQSVGSVMIGFVNSYGAVTAAAYTAASQVWTYIQMPAMALGAAVSSMAAQNVGAGKWDRVSRIARSGVLSGLAITGLIAAVIYLLGDLSLHIFLPPASPALPVAHHINNIVLWSFILFSVTFALSGVIRSTGAVWPPLLILVVSMFLIRIPFAEILIPHLGADAIWWSFPLGTIMSSALTALYYIFGNWRKTQLLEPPPQGESADVGMATPAMAEPT